MRRVAVIGGPTSAGAFAPGKEDAAAALREAGLFGALAGAGVDAMDIWDISGFKWRPDRETPRAMNAAAVGRITAEVADRVREARAADAIDFADAPLSENTDRNVGLSLDTALAALAELVRGPSAAALTVTELNPHHAAAVPGLLERFADGLAEALGHDEVS